MKKEFFTLIFILVFAFGAVAQTPENGVCAHRGASVELPENSLRAFERAIELDADWIETDVCLTRDGVAVLSHDLSTGRQCSQDVRISEKTYAELCELDLAEKFRAARNLTLEQCPKHQITRLDEALDLILKYRKARLTLHLKSGCLAEAARIVREKKAEDWIGFNGHESLLIPARQEFPNAPLFWDRYGTDVDADIELGKKLGFRTMIFNFNDVTPEKVAKVRAAGFVPGAWTVNSEAKMREMIDAGIERFYTDDPRLLLKVWGK